MARNYKDLLNRSMPIAKDLGLGDLIQLQLDAYNDLATKYAAVLAKLDADAGVTDTNYSTVGQLTYVSFDSLNARGKN